MLTKVFQSDPYKYTGEEVATFRLSGMVTQPTPTVNGPDTLYMFVEVITGPFHLTIGSELFSWDASKGLYLTNAPHSLPVLASTFITMSRGGILYFVGTDVLDAVFLIPFSISDFTNDAPAAIPASRFGLGGFGFFQLDEEVDVLILVSDKNLLIYQLSTGKFLTTVALPDSMIAIGLQNTNCIYCLCANRMLVLVDYVQGKIIGAIKGPPSLVTGGDYPVPSAVNIMWYARYQRLLLAEQVADAVPGIDSTVIRGFSPSPVATRLTIPIPLREPLTNRTIPVLACLVDDSNFGQAGALVSATVSGDDGTTKVANGIYTDTRGRANIPVQCGDEPVSIAIDCSATI